MIVIRKSNGIHQRPKTNEISPNAILIPKAKAKIDYLQNKNAAINFVMQVL